MRIAEHEIPARAGAPLGTLYAAFDESLSVRPIENETLAMTAGLTTVAIETRRLYSDLRRRSEYDILTTIYNRFSIEKRLDDQIEVAREKAAVFGLIYIDLDGFKQINDRYGHKTGDLYLKETTSRMKRQLRSMDMLARLGGDEFAVLLPAVRNRKEVEEVAQRLNRTFDDPFEIEGNIITGSASIGIALYPEDGTTKDSLLHRADSAMYKMKNERKRQVQIAEAEGIQPGAEGLA
jgi:diguanylate cyclase (GGDEF)-like protein